LETRSQSYGFLVSLGIACVFECTQEAAYEWCWQNGTRMPTRMTRRNRRIHINIPNPITVTIKKNRKQKFP
jgi:hypothetical protein